MIGTMIGDQEMFVRELVLSPEDYDLSIVRYKTDRVSDLINFLQFQL